MKIDEYKVSTLYTSAALAANAAYSIYDHSMVTPENNDTRDMIVGFFYASILGVLLSFSRRLKLRSMVSLSGLVLWAARLVSGIFIAGYTDVYQGEENSFVYWSVTILGLIVSAVSLVGQYVRVRRIRREAKKEVSPVKLRFVV